MELIGGGCRTTKQCSQAKTNTIQKGLQALSEDLSHVGRPDFQAAAFDKGSSTYTYLLADSDSREGVIIDPVKEQVDRDVSLIRELDLTIRMAVNTHCHADHITGTRLLREKIGSLSMISTTSGAKADRYFDHGDVIRFGSHSLEVRATPGHTNGCSSLVLDNDVAVFTGGCRSDQRLWADRLPGGRFEDAVQISP